MPVTGFHAAVAAVALRAAAPYGFALAGGNALMAHGVVERPTQDVDVFSDEQDGVAAAAGKVEAALVSAGFQAERRDSAGGLEDIFYGIGEGLAEWLITGPDGEQMMLQMAYFDRARKPVIMDVGPVLDLEDVVGGKVCALASRAEPRDYIDTAAALDRYSIEEMIGFARRLDPGLTDQDFADAGRRLDQWGDGVFRPYGLGPEEAARLRKCFAAWPRGLSVPPGSGQQRVLPVGQDHLGPDQPGFAAEELPFGVAVRRRRTGWQGQHRCDVVHHQPPADSQHADQGGEAGLVAHPAVGKQQVERPAPGHGGQRIRADHLDPAGHRRVARQQFPDRAGQPFVVVHGDEHAVGRHGAGQPGRADPGAGA